MTYTCIKPFCTDKCTDCNEAVPPFNIAIARANLDDLKRLRADGLAAGVGSGRWIKAATALMDAFPGIYDCAKAMNKRQSAHDIPPPQRQWVGLTDGDIASLMKKTWGCSSIAPSSAQAFAKIIEAKLKEKNCEQ